MAGYTAKYSRGMLVFIASRQELQRFQQTWRLHHKLEAEQLPFAGKVSRVASVSFYHCGDVLCQLEDIPGIWHESCLKPPEKTSY